MKQRTISIVGSYNVGLFLKGKRLPNLGETITADNFVEGAGGKGSNQAVTAAMFGADVRFIGRIGRDSYGEYALKLYQRVGISTEYIVIDKDIHSGISVILIDQAGNNMISVALGANLKLSKSDIETAMPAIESSFIVGFQLENNLETVFQGIRMAHAAGVITFLDPAPAAEIPDEIYPCIDIIKPNETEASILTGIEVKDVSGAKEAGDWFLNRGVGTAILTLGELGVVLVEPNQIKYFPGHQVQSIDTTGAGDIFSGSFLFALASGRSYEEAISFANAAAALSTERLGVIESIPDLATTNKFRKSTGG